MQVETAQQACTTMSLCVSTERRKERSPSVQARWSAEHSLLMRSTVSQVLFLHLSFSDCWTTLSIYLCYVRPAAERNKLFG